MCLQKENVKQICSRLSPEISVIYAFSFALQRKIKHNIGLIFVIILIRYVDTRYVWSYRLLPIPIWIAGKKIENYFIFCIISFTLFLLENENENEH